jgi:hypothetical protein
VVKIPNAAHMQANQSHFNVYEWKIIRQGSEEQKAGGWLDV